MLWILVLALMSTAESAMTSSHALQGLLRGQPRENLALRSVCIAFTWNSVYTTLVRTRYILYVGRVDWSRSCRIGCCIVPIATLLLFILKWVTPVLRSF